MIPPVLIRVDKDAKRHRYSSKNQYRHCVYKGRGALSSKVDEESRTRDSTSAISYGGYHRSVLSQNSFEILVKDVVDLVYGKGALCNVI